MSNPFATAGLTIVDVMESPEIFAGLFTPAPAWAAWRAALKALFGLPMDDAELAIFTACTGLAEAPTEPSLEAYWVIGRRGGKSRIAALVGVYLACFRDYAPILVEGEPGVLVIVAQDVPSGEVILGYVRALLTAVPELAAMILTDIDGRIELNNGVIIEIRAANFRAVRSRTLIGALADEVAFWWTARDSANPDVEVLTALRPGLATVPGAPLICLSSPYAEEGALYDAHKAHFGKTGLIEGEGPEGEPVTAERPLVWQAPTLTMHPGSAALEARVMAAYAVDPGAAAAEYGAKFRTVLEGFLARVLIEKAVEAGVEVRAYDASYVHRAAFDPASGTGADSAALAITRLKDGVSELCYLQEWRPEFIPSEAIRDAAALVKAYGLAAVSGDKWGKGLVADKFREHGVTYQYTDRATSAFYQELPVLLTSSAVRLLDSERLVRQMASLRRKAGSQGQDTIIHPSKAHDDLATAVTVSLVLVRARGVPRTEAEEEAQRPDGAIEAHVHAVARSKYEPMILARYPADGAARIADAKRRSVDRDGDLDPTAYAEYLLDHLPELARLERGRRSAGLDRDLP
jgi:hypothetical protein